jgi:hypothetical protein
MQGVSVEERHLHASADACFIGQNVYLFCASEGLATVFRGAVDKQALAKAKHPMAESSPQPVSPHQVAGSGTKTDLDQTSAVE